MSSQENDKTRFLPRQPSLGEGEKARVASQKRVVEPSSEMGDATRFKPGITGMSTNDSKTRVVVKSRRVEPDDRTRIGPIRAPGDTEPADDSTRITIPPPGIAAPSQTPPAADSGMLKNRFIFEEVIGTGGMGIVYKAKDMLKVEAQDRDPYVAIKVLSDEFKAHPEAFIALQRESRKTQRIAHPNIVNVHDFDRDGDTVFMTMEYMEGKPLDKLIAQYRSTGLPPEDACRILEGISAALIYAHQQNIIHSDFKPGNIFVTSNGNAKVFDFGIARAVAKAEHREESLDDKTVFDAGNLGALTPAYASLEMLEGATPDVRDDIYALGCIAYEMFTGEHPYNRVHADEAQRQKLKPKRISSLTSNQWKAIESALALRRENRVATVEEFLRKFHQKKSHTVALTAVFLVLLSAASFGAYQYWPKAPAFSEGDVRSEIEQQLRIELRMQNVSELLAAPDFSVSWEQQLWDDIQVLRRDLGTDEWLTATEEQIRAAYSRRIEDEVEKSQLKVAERLLDNARRYGLADESHAHLQKLIADARSELARLEQEREHQALLAKRRQEIATEQARVEAKQKSDFERALTTVENQLDCRNHINMDDFGIALQKLKAVSATSYQEQEARIMRMMGQCIARIGEYFPDRAEQAKERALALFGDNPLIASVKIVPKDACNSSIAGLGSSGIRATCRDILKDNIRGPVLVVTPAVADQPSFAIGKYEVTVGEFNDFCRRSGECSPASGTDLEAPITNISLDAVKNYMRWLSDESGKVYRLPTVAEWRYAATGKNGVVDPNRNCRLESRGISRGNALLRSSIGQQNDWGLVNYLGNAREWAMDRGGKLVAVGGAYASPIADCSVRSSTHHSGQPDELTGFRVLRELAQR